MSKKRTPEPKWWKNTYFWIALILFGLALFGLFRGEDAIRDPGQKDESGLVLIYLLGAIVMVVNGALSHRQTVHQYEVEQEGEAMSAVTSATEG